MRLWILAFIFALTCATQTFAQDVQGLGRWSGALNSNLNKAILGLQKFSQLDDRDSQHVQAWATQNLLVVKTFKEDLKSAKESVAALPDPPIAGFPDSLAKALLASKSDYLSIIEQCTTFALDLETTLQAVQAGDKNALAILPSKLVTSSILVVDGFKKVNSSAVLALSPSHPQYGLLQSVISSYDLYEQLLTARRAQLQGERIDLTLVADLVEARLREMDRWIAAGAQAKAQWTSFAETPQGRTELGALRETLLAAFATYDESFQLEQDIRTSLSGIPALLRGKDGTRLDAAMEATGTFSRLDVKRTELQARRAQILAAG